MDYKKLAQTLYKSINEAFDFDHIENNNEGILNSISNSAELIENKNAIRQLMMQLYQIKLPATIQPVLKTNNGWIYSIKNVFNKVVFKYDPNVHGPFSFAYFSSDFIRFDINFSSRFKNILRNNNFKNYYKPNFNNINDIDIKSILKEISPIYADTLYNNIQNIYESDNKLILVIVFIGIGNPKNFITCAPIICLNPAVLKNNKIFLDDKQEKRSQNKIVELKNNKKTITLLNKLFLNNVGLKYNTIYINDKKIPSLKTNNDNLNYIKLIPEKSIYTKRDWPIYAIKPRLFNILNLQIQLSKKEEITNNTKVIHKQPSLLGIDAWIYNDPNGLFKIKTVMDINRIKNKTDAMKVLSDFIKEDGVDKEYIKTSVYSRTNENELVCDFYSYMILTESGQALFNKMKMDKS